MLIKTYIDIDFATRRLITWDVYSPGWKFNELMPALQTDFPESHNVFLF